MRYRYLDVAKGITLLFVLMAHSCGFPFGIGGYCTAYFMTLFFVISGYTNKDVELDKKYVLKRVKKIIFPYFYYNVFIFLIYLVMKGFESSREAALAVIGAVYSTYCLHFPIKDTDFFCYRIYNNATWFLTAFFCADMFFTLYRKYCKETRQKITVFILFAVITQILYYCPVFLPWNLDKAFIGADFMILGYERKRRYTFEAEKEWVRAVKAILFVVIYVILVNFNPGINLATREYGNKGILSVGIYLIIGYTGSLICIWGSMLISKIPVIGSVFAVIGREVFPIMAMHMILYEIFNQILYRFIPAAAEGSYGWYVAFLRIGVTCAVIIGVVYGLRYIRKEKRRAVYLD